MSGFDIGLDLFPMIAAILVATTCGLLGNFLVLRRLSLMGDAISHSVLPGLVIAFLIAGTRAPMVMFLGAALAGIATVVLVELVKRFGRVEPGAAMGVVFSVLFALGVVLIERAAVRQVDLDADCVLYGQLELNFAWFGAPETWDEVLRWRTWTGYEVSPETLDPETGAVLEQAVMREGVPVRLLTLVGMALFALGFVVVLFKELRIVAFDAALATTQGFHAGALHYALMVVVAGATVASFEAVGSILVIAMLVCPGATARLWTDRLRTQLVLSVAFATLAAVTGYLGATVVPGAFGSDAVNASGAMTVASGALLALSIVASPQHGALARAVRRRALARGVAYDDLLALLYRAHETGLERVALERVRASMRGRPLQAAFGRAQRRGSVVVDDHGIGLTEQGRGDAAGLIRRHRLWEAYLVTEAGLAPDHVHESAEQLEHFDVGPEDGPSVDPHGKAIP